MAIPRNVDDYEAVETAADFVAYLNLLSADHAREVETARTSGQPFYEGNWAHRDLGCFLEAWGAWLQAWVVEGRPNSTQSIDQSWKGIAYQLAAARIYE